MSCPKWHALLERRAAGPPPREWPEAVRHLRDCADCRRRALALDPTLLFVAEPPLEVSDREVETIRRNVAALCRARRVERDCESRRGRLARPAAAAIVGAVLLLLPTHTARPPIPSGFLQQAAGGATPFVVESTSASEAPAPVLEQLDRRSARVYQFGEEDLSVVMVVDETFDI